MSYPTRIDNCAVCGTTFKTASRSRAYCSPKCRARACRLRYGDEPQTPNTVKYRNEILNMVGVIPQREIAARLGVHRRTVEQVVAKASGEIAPRKVPPYKCPECAKHGIHSPTDWKPCIACAGRKARAGR